LSNRRSLACSDLFHQLPTSRRRKRLQGAVIRWRRTDDGSQAGHAELELQRDFMNEAGKASVFAVGDIHSIEYGDDTFFIRVTGGDVETKKTLRFDLEKKSVQIADRAQGQR